MSQIGTAYGQALYSLAREEGRTGPILEELTALGAAFEKDPEYLRLLSAPGLSKEERCGILDQAFRGKVDLYVLNFLKLLAEKGAARHFPQCVEAYEEQYNLDNGILPVTAVTAVPLSGSQSARLTEKLSAMTGKTVVLKNRVDPAQLGGVRLDYDGKRVEDTVAHRLEAVRAALRETLL